MDGSNVEFQEKNRISTDTVTADEFMQKIQDPETLELDPRFQEFKQGGAFKYFFPGMVDHDNTFFTTVKENEKVVGLAQLTKDPYHDRNLWINFVSVDPQYQGRGYGRKVLEEVFRFATQEKYDLQGSRYSDEGQEKLSAIVDELAAKFPGKYVRGENI